MNLINKSPVGFTFMNPLALQARKEMEKTKALDNAARAYSVQCADKAKRLTGAFMLKQISQWSDLGFDDIPEFIKAQPLTFLTLQQWLVPWVKTAEARFKLQETARKVEVATISTRFEKAQESTGITQVGRFTLRPRQRKAVDLIIERLRSGSTQAVVCPLEGGEGKSVIGWAIVKYWQENSYFGHLTGKMPLPNQAVFTTAAAVQIDMEARGRACEVANMNKLITVISHTQWNTKAYAHFFREEKIELFGTKVTRFKYIMPAPAVIIIDENDAYKKPESQKSMRLEAVVRAGVEQGSVFVFMSATPWVTINDTWLFCMATGRKWKGERINRENFPSMARAIAARVGVRPDANSPAAMAEFRKEFNDCYIVPPKDPSKVKVYNQVLLLEFENNEDKLFYDRTMDRYYEELERIGKGGHDVNKMTAFLKLAQSEEWLKRKYFVRLALDAHKRGFAPVIGCRFQATVNDIVRALVHDHGIPRTKISVIQGGSEIITREKLAKIIGPQLFDRIGELVMKYYSKTGDLCKEEKTAVRKYMRWIKERARNEETEGQQALRQDQLNILRLGKQTPIQRHEEKENFQNGETEFMVFTLGSGGRGIDMDQQFQHVRPREGYFTICYWVEEFMQALYRLKRVATLSDVHQFIVFFKGTLVANHMAPRLDKKIKSVRAGVLGTDDFVEEAMDIMEHARQKPAPEITQFTLRDGTDTVDDMTEGFDPDAEIEKLKDDEDDE